MPAPQPPIATPGSIPVTFVPGDRVALVAPGTALLDAARSAGQPLAASCGGEAVCGWCVVQVLSGAAALTPPDDAERARLRARSRAPDERLACRARALGPVTVTTSYW